MASNSNSEPVHAIATVGKNQPALVVGAGLALLALVHLVLVMHQALGKTPTVDEVAHLPAGLSYMETRSFRTYRHTPPLARILMGLATKTAGPHTDYNGTWRVHDPVNHWQFAFEFLWWNRSDAARYFDCFTRGRFAIALVSAATIPVIYSWGAWWLGQNSGWLAAGLWAFCPNVIAHAGLATTDLCSASSGLVASLLFARWLDRPSWSRSIAAGAGLGVAQLIKFSSLILYGLWMLWWLADRLHRTRRATMLWNVPQAAAIILTSILVINAGYLCEGSFTPLGQFKFVCRLLTRPRLVADGPPDVCHNQTYNEVYRGRVNRFRGSWLAWLPCPLPFHYVSGFDEQKFEADGKYQMYLRGELRHEQGEDSRSGWWYYYLYALAIKVPISTWLLLVMATYGAVRWGGASQFALAVWSAFVVVMLAMMSLLTDINIGLRYLLPAFPFLFLVAGSAAHFVRPVWWNAFILAGMAWNVGVLARIHPHELSYFNELIGGPANGRFHLIDSNLDWGQDLRGLIRWLAAHPGWQDLRLAYFGTIAPEMEGLQSYRLAPRNIRFVPGVRLLPGEDMSDPWSYGPQPGKYAVSVNFERGMEFHSPRPESPALDDFVEHRGALLPGSMGQLILHPARSYAYFQHFTPLVEPEIGYSILLYDITIDDANRVRGELGMPKLPTNSPMAPMGRLPVGQSRE